MNAYDRNRLTKEMEHEYRKSMRGCSGFIVTAVIIALFTLGVVLAFRYAYVIGSLISAQ